MREFINRYGVVLVSASLVLAAIIWYVFGRSSIGSTGSMDKGWFIDENTGDVSVMPSTEIPPLVGKDGKQSVVGLVKISCDNGRNPVVAYYRRWAPQAKEKMEQLRSSSTKNRESDRELQEWTQRGEEIRLPGPGNNWVGATTPEGQKILDSVVCQNGNVAIAINPP